MSAEFLDTTVSQIRELIARLQAPIPDIQTLTALLASPLDALGLLPPPYRRYNTAPLPPDAFSLPRHLPPIQRALLEHIIPTWEPLLAEQKLIPLIEQYFVPDAFSNASPAAGSVALHAYATLLALPLTPFSIKLLARLSQAYPIDRLHATVFAQRSRGLAWEDAVRNVLAVPAKVANALGGAQDAPAALEQGRYFAHLCARCEVLVASLAPDHTKEITASLVYLLGKLVNVGAFPSSLPSAPSQPSFFHSTLPTIRARLAAHDAAGSTYSAYWAELLMALPSTFTLQGILTSLFSHLSPPTSDLDAGPRARAQVKREAQLLCALVGRLTRDKRDLWDAVTAVVLGRDWSQVYARVYVCWTAGAQQERVDEEALEVLLTKALDLWSSHDHIKHSLLSKHHYATLLLLTTVSYFSASSPVLGELILSPSFVRSVGIYIAHLDPAVRRCGMLVAEELARRTGKKLSFDDWDGDDSDKPWARAVRALIAETDASASADPDADEAPAMLDLADLLTDDIIAPPKAPLAMRAPGAGDSDDSLTGYASPPSSRSASPSPSELAEIEKDPSLRIGRTKIARPVYLAQLGAMLRGPGGLKSEYESQEAERHEVALAVAEELVRRKAGYGTELEENAVNLVYALVGLNDNYEIDDFDRKRQAALNALVACCPTKAAPCLIEEFFKNQYSSDQRIVMLNALALGARELAGLPLPPDAPVQPLPAERTAFPSKRLPPALHRKYIAGQVQGLLQGITRESIASTQEANADKAPELARSRRLRLAQPTKVSETQKRTPAELARDIRTGAASAVRPQRPAFASVAAEHFVCPLIHRFWLFLRDEQTREARTAGRYAGAGTGLILSALVLAHLLATLGVLVHAARNAPAWGAVIAPEVLELAVTLGTRPVALSGDDDDGSEEDRAPGAEGRQDKEARVLTTALELALIVLDGSMEVDGGRSLSLEHTALLLATGEWAGEVFQRLEKGVLVRGGGGAAEMRLSKAAAGVVLKANEVSERWKRSMIDLTR